MTLKRILKVIQTGTIRKLGCGFLFVFHSNYGSILHHLQDKARYWSKVVIFFIPPLHLMPTLGGSPSEYCHPVWCGKTRMVGLPDGEKDRYNRLDSIPACDRQTTDRWADGRTDILRRHSPRYAYAYACRGKNCGQKYRRGSKGSCKLNTKGNRYE